MQFPESWLREFCDPSIGTVELAALLTMAGLEVEHYRPAAPPFSGVVVAEIVECEPHPQADRLSVCRVDAGQHSKDGLLQIVCGAPNARAGLRVPLALVGAKLPPGVDGKPFEIDANNLRGVESLGMLCSARELRLSDDHGGLLELSAQAPLGVDLRRVLNLDDALFTLKLTPNLGHCLSVFGIAREVSALTGAELKVPSFPPVLVSHATRLPVVVAAPDLCGRFSGRVVSGVNPAAATPAWMADRLVRCGQRPVNALVDISNYVMFEFGRPSHIFDLDKIDSGLEVRWGRTGEHIKLLNGSTIEVDSSVGVIADASRVESLAGIMGGDATAVSDDTRNVYVEAAFWWPEAVAGRSRRFNFSTEAGHRFERGVDPASTVEHIERITSLILQICGGSAGPVDDHCGNIPRRPAVALRVSRAVKVIGMQVEQERCAEVFRSLKFDFVEEPDRLLVTPPSWRFDLNIEEDLIEEVIRILGFNALPAGPPTALVVARMPKESRRSVHTVRRLIAGRGYQETISFSFVEERWERELAGNLEPIRVLNPIAAPLSMMRSSLIGSLVDGLRHNLSHRAARVRLFEVGRVFRRDSTVCDGELSVAGVDQPMRLGGLAYGHADELQWGSSDRAIDFFDVKGDVQALFHPRLVQCRPTTHVAFHPGRSATLHVDGRVVGVIGELHPRWRQAYSLAQAPVLFEVELNAVLEAPTPVVSEVPRQPAAHRDVALLVPGSASHDGLIAALRDDPSGLLRGAVLFDIYRPDSPGSNFESGARSMAVRLEFQDAEATLTDEQIEVAVSAALKRAALAVGARLRT